MFLRWQISIQGGSGPNTGLEPGLNNPFQARQGTSASRPLPTHSPLSVSSFSRSLKNIFHIYQSPEKERDIAGNIPLFAIISGVAIALLHSKTDLRFAFSALISGIALAVVAHQLTGWQTPARSLNPAHRPFHSNERVIRHPAELNALARAGILAGPNASFDFADFAIRGQSERTSHPETVQLRREWALFLENTRGQIENEQDPIRKARLIVRELDATFGISKIDDAQSNMNEFLLHRRGNCEARAWLIVSALQALNIQFPEPYELGIQKFGKSRHSTAGHIQLVLYNKDTGSVLDLLTGVTQAQVLAPIYKTKILLLAYLAADFTQSAFVREHPSSSFLIVNPLRHSTATPSTPLRDISSDSLSAFPPNDFVYEGASENDGTNEIHLNFSDLEENGDNSNLNTNEGGFRVVFGYPALSRPSRYWRVAFSNVESTIYIRYRRDMLEYSRFQNAVEAFRFIKNLYSSQISQTLNSPVLVPFLNEVRSPESIFHYNASQSWDELNEVFASLHENAAFLNDYTQTLTSNHPHRASLSRLRLLRASFSSLVQIDPFRTLLALEMFPNQGDFFRENIRVENLNARAQASAYEGLHQYFSDVVSSAPHFIPLLDLENQENVGAHLTTGNSYMSIYTAKRLEIGLRILDALPKHISHEEITRPYFDFLMRWARADFVNEINQTRNLSLARGVFLDFTRPLYQDFLKVEFARNHGITYEDFQNWEGDIINNLEGYRHRITHQFIAFRKPAHYIRILRN